MNTLKSKNIVAKANDLIMAKYDLSLAEQRLILEVASMVHPQHDDDFLVYDVSVKDYVNLVNSTTKNEYQRMKGLAESLLKKPLFIKNDDGGFTGLNWFSSLRYIPSEGVLRCRFDKDLKPYMLKLNEFYTSYQLENILRLKSKYAIRLYEILKSQHDLKQKKSKSKKISWEVELDELRKMIAIPDSYTWQDIKRQILKQAEKELLSTNIRFTYTVRKRGRKIHAIIFDIIDTGQLALELEPVAPKSDSDAPANETNEKNPASELLDLVPAAEKKDVKKLIAAAAKKYPEAYIREKITLANAEKNLKNYGAWLRQAIADDYKKSEKSEKKSAQKPKKQKTKKTKDDKKTEQEIAEQRKIRKKFAALEEAEKSKWIARARSEAAECGGADLLPHGLILIHASQLWAENV
ncbi:MAG: replication initiation protein [Dissulfuribacterales bacterium]